MSTLGDKAALLDELIAEVEGRIDSLESKLSDERRLLSLLTEKRQNLGGQDAPPPVKAEASAVRHPADPPKSIPQYIYDALQVKGKPMAAKDITRAVEQMGATTDSKRGLNPMVLSALARRPDLFNRVERGRYGLTEWIERAKNPEEPLMALNKAV